MFVGRKSKILMLRFFFIGATLKGKNLFQSGANSFPLRVAPVLEAVQCTKVKLFRFVLGVRKISSVMATPLP